MAAGAVPEDDMLASDAVRALKDDVHRQMKALKAAGKLGDGGGGAAGKGSSDAGAVAAAAAEEEGTKKPTDSGDEKTADSSTSAPPPTTVSVEVPRNIGKLLASLEARVAGLEATIQDLHTAQLLGDEAIDCVLRGNPRHGDPGVPYFVFDALEVPVDDDPFPALHQRPVQVLRAPNFVMQEDRTARLIAGLKTPMSRTLCELHFVNCEWDLVQATDVADAVHTGGLNIAVLNLSRSQTLKGDTLAGFFAHPMPHLRTLDLAYCQHVDDASIVRALAWQCRYRACVRACVSVWVGGVGVACAAGVPKKMRFGALVGGSPQRQPQ